MKIDITDAIIKLSKESDKIKHFINKKLPEIKEKYRDKNSSIDKHIDGWEIDGEAIQSFNIRLSYKSFTGKYGDSSTYSDFIPDNAIVREYFIKYLNNHTEEIFNEIANLIKEDAIHMKNQSLKELEDMKNFINNL